MVFVIVLSLDIKNIQIVSYYKKILIEEALKNNCEIYFLNYEVVGKNRKFFKHHLLFTFIFEENEELIAKFIHFVKTKAINIESIVYKNNIYELMYVSSKYLSIIDKEKANEYIEKRKSNNLFKQDSIIIKTLKKC